jgi:lipoate-protein ligase A
VRLRWPGKPVPLTRRSTGGGIVFHDGDVTFSYVFPWPELSTPVFVYREVHMAVQLGLKAHGFWSRLWRPGPSEGDAGPRKECFSGPEPEDLVDAGGGKVLGGALRRRRGVGLYQGSLRPEGFAPAPRERLARAVLEGFSLQKGTIFVPREPRPATAAEAQRLRGERYGAEHWNKKR